MYNVFRNFKLLSFGDEAEEDEIENDLEQTKYVGKSKSTHDVLNDPKLSSKTIHDEINVEDDVDKSKLVVLKYLYSDELL